MFDIRSKDLKDGTKGRAVFSEDGEYRYLLSRSWNAAPSLVFIMLNPSTGNEHSLEATTAGCLTRAKNWNYGGMIVVNLFALISTDPTKLKDHPDPIGPHNDYFLTKVNEFAAVGSTVVCAWGKHGALNNRDNDVLEMLHMPKYVLELNKDGSPRHPLHMSHKIEPRIWQA
jgi:hypothetical protein